jgi:hypothetical protein
VEIDELDREKLPGCPCECGRSDWVPNKEISWKRRQPRIPFVLTRVGDITQRTRKRVSYVLVEAEVFLWHRSKNRIPTRYSNAAAVGLTVRLWETPNRASSITRFRRAHSTYGRDKAITKETTPAVPADIGRYIVHIDKYLHMPPWSNDTPSV